MIAYLDRRFPAARAAWERAGAENPVAARELGPWLARLPRSTGK
jgi:hypothetical protein